MDVSSSPTLALDSMTALFQPMSFSVMILLSILAVCIARFLGIHSTGKDKHRRRHPIGGTIFHLLLNINRLHHYLTGLASRHKTYRLLTLFRSMVFTTDPKNVEHFLKTNFANYGKGTYHYSILTNFLGDGIFTVDGENWRQQRKVSSYEFSTKVLRDFSSVVFRSSASKLAKILSEAAASNQSIEIQELFMKSTTDSVFKVILGVELDNVCGTNEEGVRFSEAFDQANAITLYRYVNLHWKITRFLNIGSEAVLKDCIKVVDEFVYKIIQSKIEQQQTKDHSPMKREDFLSRLLVAKGDDPKYLRDIILSFIIAGKDSTATTMSWFLYMLCKHPLIQQKVAKEVREAAKLKEGSNFDEIGASITEEALDRMQYLHAALTETLRLYPPVPVDGKLCFSDDTWPDGYEVKKGDLVFYHPYAMGRMRYIWGDDAELFLPERWLDEDGNFHPESPFKFTAFQAGPRICLGKEFAYRETKIISAVLLSAYAFRLSDKMGKVNYKIMLTMPIEGGLHVCVDRRTDQGSYIDG